MSGARPNALIALAGAFLIATGGSGAALAQQPNAQPGCGLVVESGPDQWIMTFDPLSESEAARQFDLAVVNRGDSSCAGVIGVDLRGEPFGLALNGGGDRLAYALVDERTSTDITPRAGETTRRAGGRPFSLGPGERGLLRFSLAVDTSDLLGAGLYSQTAFVTVQNSNGTPLAEKPVTLGVRVASAALMGIKGEFRRSGGLATIDLGQLTEGSRALNTSLYVLSTSGYSVSVSSANGGRLRQGESNWFVPYTLTIGDRDVDLSRARRLDVVSSRPRIDDYPLSINLGSVAGRRAGDYTDIVTFTVAAL